MSYEGYQQYLCPEGHLWNLDCNWHMASPLPELQNGWPLCPDCKKPPVWTNPIDETNSCDKLDDKGHHPGCQCGFVDLELIEPVKDCVCPNCGSHHVKEAPRYKIPETGGRKVDPNAQEGEGTFVSWGVWCRACDTSFGNDEEECPNCKHKAACTGCDSCKTCPLCGKERHKEATDCRPEVEST